MGYCWWIQALEQILGQKCYGTSRVRFASTESAEQMDSQSEDGAPRRCTGAEAEQLAHLSQSGCFTASREVTDALFDADGLQVGRHSTQVSPGTEGDLGQFPFRGPLAEETGPRELLADRHVLVLCDAENLSYGAESLGYRLSYFRLARWFQGAAKGCELHAFYSCEPDDLRSNRYFSRRGWIPHAHPIETVRTGRGSKRLANSDNLILLWAGWLAATSEADSVIVASGDGTLVHDIARFLTCKQPDRPVMTLSLAGSTSLRLDALYNPFVKANLCIGKDVLRRLTAHHSNCWGQREIIPRGKAPWIPFESFPHPRPRFATMKKIMAPIDYR